MTKFYSQLRRGGKVGEGAGILFEYMSAQFVGGYFI